jgi:hypothetical protein
MADAYLRRLQRQSHESPEALERYIHALERAVGGVESDADDMITLSRGGTEEREVNINHLQIPDIWHLIQAVRDLPDFGAMADELDEIYPENPSEAGVLGEIATTLRNIDGFGGEVIAKRFRDVWGIAHDLKKHIQGL